ncbi:MAG: bifunctional metallophosphatase/5'-nucleotidase [Methanomicrobiaceae archaeon]|nr:bifunctional metallophosphatase/5'-nucleotidase [Methanomicrobiaceae archaeon]
MEFKSLIKPVFAVALLLIVAVFLGSFLLNAETKGICGKETGILSSNNSGLNNDFSGSKYSGAITVLTTPDIHSHLFQMSDNDTGSRIGRISALADTLGEESPDTLYLFAGDLGEGSFYHTYAGVPEVTTYSMAGFDAAVLGNHAFDFSTDGLKQWVTNASYPVICANLRFSDPVLNKTITDYTILEAGGAKVGVFGIITPDLKKIVNLPEGVYLNENTTESGTRAVNSLRDEGVDIIIALTHQNREEDTKFAESVQGIDLIIGGHDHLVWNETVTDADGEKTLIVHAGKYGEETDSVDLVFENGTLAETSVKRFIITEKMPDDSAITSYIMPFYESYSESLSEPVGYTTVPLDVSYETIRTKETNTGDLITDTIRGNVPGVDIAFINSGSIRGDTIIPAGEISYLTLNTILPYENLIVKIQMTGSEIKDTLERSASAIVAPGDDCKSEERTDSGGFLQVSGVRFTINTKGDVFCCDYDTDTVISKGDRILNLSVVSDSGIVPIDLKETYTVAVNDYMAGGGDGYTNLEDISDDKKYNTEINLIDLLAAAIERDSPITPVTDGRIVVV